VAAGHDRAPGLAVLDQRDERIDVVDDGVDLVDLDAHTRRPAPASPAWTRRPAKPA